MNMKTIVKASLHLPFLSLLISSLHAQTYDITFDILTDYDDTEYAAVTGPNSASPNYVTGAITIPATVERDGQSYPVTTIGDDAFRE
jgi:hypothetical protein